MPGCRGGCIAPVGTPDHDGGSCLPSSRRGIIWADSPALRAWLWRDELPVTVRCSIEPAFPDRLLDGRCARWVGLTCPIQGFMLDLVPDVALG